MKIKYGISGGFNDEQMRQVHETALRIIDEIGFSVQSPEVPTQELLDRVSAVDGVRVVNGRVCFRPYLVEKFLNEYRESGRNAGSSDAHELTIRTCRHSFNFLDPLTDRLRPCATQDLIEFTRLGSSYYEEGVRGGCPGQPHDVPIRLQNVMAYKIGLEHGRGPLGPDIRSIETADYLLEMAAVMGQEREDSHAVGVHPVSPMRLEGNQFDIALHLWKKAGNNLTVNSGPMPIIGVSAPIFFPGALAQSLAEGLGCFAFFKCLTGKGAFWFNFYAFDMKYGNFVYGGPEDSLIALIRKQMHQWYGLPGRGQFGDKSLLTMAHSADSQAAAEKAAKTVVALLAGADYLAGAGSLSLDESCSLEQLVIDVEIVRWAKRLAAGFEFDREALGFDIVKNVVFGGGEFLTHESTLTRYRETYWTPDLFEHLMKSQWNEKGSRPLRERAREIVRQRLASHRHHIPEDKRRELERIYANAAAALSS